MRCENLRDIPAMKSEMPMRALPKEDNEIRGYESRGADMKTYPSSDKSWVRRAIRGAVRATSGFACYS